MLRARHALKSPGYYSLEISRVPKLTRANIRTYAEFRLWLADFLARLLAHRSRHFLRMARMPYDAALRKFKAAVRDHSSPALSDAASHLRAAAGHLIAAVGVLGRQVSGRRVRAFLLPNDELASRKVSRRKKSRQSTNAKARHR
jgi:hypothetical protein